jgi:hypothetical protein
VGRKLIFYFFDPIVFFVVLMELPHSLTHSLTHSLAVVVGRIILSGYILSGGVLCVGV